MLKFRQLFNKKCSVIGMVHVAALPGTPLFKDNLNESISKAKKETELYLQYNLDGILVENMHDVPYIQAKNFGPEITATMSRICAEIRTLVPDNIPCGVQVLSCGNREALAIAKACSLDFIRAEGYVFSHIGDEGFTDANAGSLLRYRKQICGDNVLVLADIKKKHSSHAITNDISLEETAKAAEFFLADGIILTGTSTGVPAKVNELDALKKATKLPILIGSGVTIENVTNYLAADAFIVGSHFKVNGSWENKVDEHRVKAFMDNIRGLIKE